MKKYYLTDGTGKVGPFSFRDLQKLLSTAKLSILDQVYDSESDEWIPVLDLAEKRSERSRPSKKSKPKRPTRGAGLATTGIVRTEILQTEVIPGLMDQGVKGNHVRSRPTAKQLQETRFEPLLRPIVVEEKTQSKTQTKIVPTIEVSTTSQFDLSEQEQWYILRDGLAQGPYQFTSMLILIKDGTLKETDQIRKKGESDWQRASEVPDFQTAVVKSVNTRAARHLAREGYFRRKEVRTETFEHVRASDGDRIFYVTMCDLSHAGCGLVTNAPVFQEGQKIYLGLFEDDEVPYNTEGVVVRTQQREEDGRRVYKTSVQFETVTEKVHTMITEILKKGAAS